MCSDIIDMVRITEKQHIHWIRNTMLKNVSEMGHWLLLEMYLSCSVKLLLKCICCKHQCVCVCERTREKAWAQMREREREYWVELDDKRSLRIIEYRCKTLQATLHLSCPDACQISKGLITSKYNSQLHNKLKFILCPLFQLDVRNIVSGWPRGMLQIWCDLLFSRLGADSQCGDWGPFCC